MGMFDNIEVDYPFPEGYENFRGQDGQTKSMDCTMTYYFITEEGKLFILKDIENLGRDIQNILMTEIIKK